MKRSFDILFSFIGLLFVAPLLICAAIIIKRDSRGPVFFKQERVGKGGKHFTIYKLRTMVENASTLGPGLTERNDARITRVGKILRWLKVDELPQLINVLKGDMSLVGPRPEVSEIVALYSERERRVVSVRPGIVGPSQIRWRHEVEEYPDGVDTEQYYIEQLLPKKLQVDLDYVDNPSHWKDLSLVFSGIVVTLIGAFGRRSLTQWKKIS